MQTYIKIDLFLLHTESTPFCIKHPAHHSIFLITGCNCRCTPIQLLQIKGCLKRLPSIHKVSMSCHIVVVFLSSLLLVIVTINRIFQPFFILCSPHFLRITQLCNRKIYILHHHNPCLFTLSKQLQGTLWLLGFAKAFYHGWNRDCASEEGLRGRSRTVLKAPFVELNSFFVVPSVHQTGKKGREYDGILESAGWPLLDDGLGSFQLLYSEECAHLLGYGLRNEWMIVLQQTFHNGIRPERKNFFFSGIWEERIVGHDIGDESSNADIFLDGCGFHN